MSSVSFSPGKGPINTGFGGEPLINSNGIASGPIGVPVVPGTPVRWGTFGHDLSPSQGTVSFANASCSGLAVADDVGGRVDYRFRDIVTLTTAQWDVVLGTTGGLNPGSLYYVSDVTQGRLSPVLPSTPGNYITFVGFAISTTELQLQLSAPQLVP